MVCQILAVKAMVLIQIFTNSRSRCKLNISKIFCKIPKKTFRKSFMLITASDFCPATLLKLNSTMDIFPRSFTNLASTAISHNGCFYVKGSYNLLSVFALKNSCCKTFRKTAEGLQLFIIIRGFPLSFPKFLLTAAFQKLSRVCFSNDILSVKKSRKERSFRKK